MEIQLSKAAQAALIDANIDSNLALAPSLLTNNHLKGQKVLSILEDALLSCDSFCFSVAFITRGGITPLLETFKELEKRQVQGRILTTDYLTFSDPEALLRLSQLGNIELRMYNTKNAPGFHTKGYIFQNDDVYRIIIGSSNMTLNALTVNQEWNTNIVSMKSGALAQDVVNEFEKAWFSAQSEVFDESAYQAYKTKYEVVKKQRTILSKETIVSLDAYKLSPNKMQIAFLENLRRLQEEGKRRALLISATGTGKTYASAFGLRDVLLNEASDEKVLFLVHREQIARQAMKTFRNVFGSKAGYGLLSGSSKQTNARFLFSTMQMMAKDEVREQFDRREFSYIVLDEAHRTGAVSYKKIMNYFNPSFWLGMTASPERMDDFDVFALFDHNIAYEIRLQQAMEEDLLCPFHYFGITELEIDGEVFDDETGVRNFRYLVCDQRVDYILEQAQYYGHSGDRVKGLIFCSRREEADELSRKFNERGYRTISLGGDDSQTIREEMVDRLTSDDREDYLDYIFTVDIFNEGVDLPEINQVIMLRPTQSPIVFVQQLGRGLRKADQKEFVVVLDFIGNYKNNFMIPIALSGDRTYNKDNVRRYVLEGTRIIPGSSTIHFDEISRKRIFAAIDSANFSDIRLIKENYKNLKYKLGRIPALIDFDFYGEMDVLRIFDNKSLGSYYKFLHKYEPDYRIRLSETEEKTIEFISKKLASGKRIHEIALIKILLEQTNGLMSRLSKDLKSSYNISLDTALARNIVNVLTNEFPAGSGKKTYEKCIFIDKDGDDYKVSEPFSKMLTNPDFYDMVQELVSFAEYRFKRDYSNRYQNTDFVLYQKYTYEDACRLLGWSHNEVPQNIGGYKYDSETKTFPVFINYDKSEDIQDTINYEDRFLNPERLIAISKGKRKVSSNDVQNFLNAKERGIDVHLFIRKNKDDKISQEFYYLGRMKATGYTKQFIMPNTTSTAVEIEWALDEPVRADIYEYITKG